MPPSHRERACRTGDLDSGESLRNRAPSSPIALTRVTNLLLLGTGRCPQVETDCNERWVTKPRPGSPYRYGTIHVVPSGPRRPSSLISNIGLWIKHSIVQLDRASDPSSKQPWPTGAMPYGPRERVHDDTCRPVRTPHPSQMGYCNNAFSLAPPGFASSASFGSAPRS